MRPPSKAILSCGAADPSLLRVQLLLVAAAIAFVVRIVIACCSWGTTDTIGFLRFAWEIRDHGLLETYRSDEQLNHPPVPPYWARLALKAIDPNDHAATTEDVFWFAPLLRLPMIVADALTAWLLWRIWRGRGRTPAAAAAVVAAYAWNPVALLTSGYHGNTDPVYACLALLAVHLLQDRNRPFWGGLALGLAINVKLIPLLLIPPLAIGLPRRADVAKFAGGLALCVLPFLPPLLFATEAFCKNALAYKSLLTLWGVQFFLLMPHPPASGRPDELTAATAKWYWHYGRYVLLGAVFAWAIVARVFNRKGKRDDAVRWNLFTIAAVTFALFIVLAPGFGVQYLVVLVPMLYAVNPRFATAYGIVAGLFQLCAYYHYWDGEFPLSSLFDDMFPTWLGTVGLASWGLLIHFIASTVIRGNVPPSRAARTSPS